MIHDQEVSISEDGTIRVVVDGREVDPDTPEGFAVVEQMFRDRPWLGFLAAMDDDL